MSLAQGARPHVEQQAGFRRVGRENRVTQFEASLDTAEVLADSPPLQLPGYLQDHVPPLRLRRQHERLRQRRHDHIRRLVRRPTITSPHRVGRQDGQGPRKDTSQTSQMIAPEFLDLEQVLEIHTLQLAEFGGIAGVRDQGLLHPATEQPVQPRLASSCMPTCRDGSCLPLSYREEPRLPGRQQTHRAGFSQTSLVVAFGFDLRERPSARREKSARCDPALLAGSAYPLQFDEIASGRELEMTRVGSGELCAPNVLPARTMTR